jgi:hypothetical protein
LSQGSVRLSFSSKQPCWIFFILVCSFWNSQAAVEKKKLLDELKDHVYENQMLAWSGKTCDTISFFLRKVQSFCGVLFAQVAVVVVLMKPKLF